MIPQEELIEYRAEYARKKRLREKSHAWYHNPEHPERLVAKARYAKDGYRKNHPERVRKARESYNVRTMVERKVAAAIRRADPERNTEWRRRRLANHAKRRAVARDLPYSITWRDVVIPKVCPVLGIELATVGEGVVKPNTPSLDRIVPERGYVKGNIVVVSHRANSIKNNATLAELRRIVAFYADKMPE